MSKVRVRFAPSPTGMLHLGSVRSALFDWLYAQKEQGSFILRLEDTDRERLVPESVNQIQDSLKWLGLDWDEGIVVGGKHGPYVQSERLDIYKKYADQLVEQGSLYPCWCSTERLDNLRKQAQAEHKAFKYDRHCLTNLGDPDEPHVLRFKVPEGRAISWNDAVRGPLEFSSDDQDDFVAMKSDGFPTYNFANIVDDHLMEISHVLRGDEFISTTPKFLLVYEAFGWQPPIFAHLPQVLGPDKAKLSKRHGAKPVLDYRDEGYLPDAIINFVVALGWNEGDGSTKEIYTRDELIKAFSLERIQKSPAVFDSERLIWMNGLYLRSLSLDALLAVCKPFWPKEAASSPDDYKKAVLGLLQERLKILSELPELSSFFFNEPRFDLTILKKAPAAKETKEWLKKSLEIAEKTDFMAEKLEQAYRDLAEALQIKTGDLFSLVRVSITGSVATPPLFETMAVLGKTRVAERLKNALKSVAS